MKIPEFKDPKDLIWTINRQMSAEQAIAQIEELNRLERNKSKIPVEDARRQLLRDNGYNPADWTYYSGAARLDAQSDEAIMERLARNFPEDVEFLVIQGDFIGGLTGKPGEGSWGIGRYTFLPNSYTAFIRVRPKQIKQ